MRKLTRNEQFLLGVLGLVIFAGVNIFGFRALKQKGAGQALEYGQLKADQAEAQVSLRSRTDWEQRETWISLHEPVGKDGGDAQAQVLQDILKDARGKKLQVMAQSLNDTMANAKGFRVEVALTVKGSLQALIQWQAHLQDPEGFYAVPYVSLKADGEQKAMVGSFRIYRYFRKGT